MDQTFRSILSEAEEKVPGRVWSGISERLAVPAPSGKAAWWWICGSVVAAGAIALALVLFLPKSNVPEQIPIAPELLAQAIEPSSVPINTIAQNPVPSGIVSDAAPIVQAEEPDFPTVSPEPETETEAEAPVTAPAEVSAIPTPVHQDWNIREAEATISHKPVVNFNSSMGGNISGLNRNTAPRAIKKMAVRPPKPGSLIQDGEATFGIPVTFGFGVKVPLSNRFAIGSGVNYSLLTESWEARYVDELSEQIEGNVLHKMDYIGIPLNVYFNLLHTTNFNFYAVLGGEAEYCVRDFYSFKGEGISHRVTKPVSGLQYSVGLGLGTEYRINNTLSLFLDPSVRYFFPGEQPTSIRTTKPLMLSAELGLRLDL